MAETKIPLADADGLAERVLVWIKAHRQATAYAVAAVVVGGALVWWNTVSTQRSEDRAWDLLAQARVAFESGNLPLAGSEFSRIAENYGGTRAAEQASLLLAQVRLRQGQPQLAVDVLSRLTGSASAAFRAQAWNLLGAAYENTGSGREAAAAYEQAAEHGEYPFMQAQSLSDAGRAWTAVGDTARALAAYQKILKDLPETGSVQEAALRVAELTRGEAELPRGNSAR